MLDLVFTTQFRRDLKRLRKQGAPIEKLDTVLQALRRDERLSARYRDHALTGDYSGFRECHIMPDWLLIYESDGDTLLLYLLRTGTHSDLFKM